MLISNHHIKNRGNLALEFAVLMVALGLAILAMQVYVKRAVTGRLKQSIDAFGQGRLYEPK